MQRLLLPIGLLCVVRVGHAEITIDFGPDFGAPARTVELTDQLADYGITFSSSSPQGVLWHGTDPPISSFSYCINAGWDGPWGSTEPIRVDFSTYVTDVAIRGFDGGGDVDTLILRAYDSQDDLVDVTEITAGFAYPGRVASVAALEIAYATFEVEGTHSGLFFDDLSFSTVPSPAVIPLLGAAALLRARRRRSA